MATQLNPLIFLQEVRTELGKVRWPTREETIKLTTVVIIISTAFGLFIGAVDLVLVKAVDIFLIKH